jgi:hypothetical protein
MQVLTKDVVSDIFWGKTTSKWNSISGRQALSPNKKFFGFSQAGVRLSTCLFYCVLVGDD